jgi:hypothetical protein
MWYKLHVGVWDVRAEAAGEVKWWYVSRETAAWIFVSMWTGHVSRHILLNHAEKKFVHKKRGLLGHQIT